MFELPPSLSSEGSGGAIHQPGIQVEFYAPNPDNVATETLDKLKPKAIGIVPEIVFNVPQKTTDDAFALRFKGN